MSNLEASLQATKRDINQMPTLDEMTQHQSFPTINYFPGQAADQAAAFEVPVMVPCKACTKLLPLSSDNFYRLPASPNGYRSTCITCVLEQQKTKRFANKLLSKEQNDLSTLIIKLEKEPTFLQLVKAAITYIEKK